MVSLTYLFLYPSFKSSVPIHLGHSDADAQIPIEIRTVVGFIGNLLYK